MLSVLIFTSLRQVFTISMHFVNKSIFTSSNLALVNFVEKSIASDKQGISIKTSESVEINLLALSQLSLNLPKAFRFLLISFLCFL
ncbi:hypothetical protein HanIR_Chr02g0061351 [Helianthus annuus]|nr:hypothetical protein HanIR_Chr02g0061351 [Helianthus annuus]